jgi:hypothetical protein
MTSRPAPPVRASPLESGWPSLQLPEDQQEQGQGGDNALASNDSKEEPLMSNDNRWTSEMLRTPEGRAIHLQQRRAQILPIADDLRRLAREFKADLAEDGRLHGDLPYQDRLRAKRTAKPLFDAVEALESALAELVTASKRYEKSYEVLPAKREAKELEKKRAKELKASGGAPVQSLPAGQAGTEGGSFADVMSKGA